MDWKQCFCFLVLVAPCCFVAGYVELESYDLDLERRSLTLYFTLSVQRDTLDLSNIRFVDNDTLAAAQFTPSGGTSTSVNDTTISVTLSESDVTSMVAIPGLCLNQDSCYMAFHLDLIRDTNGGPTFPGVKKVSKFTPYPLYLEQFDLDLNRGELTLGFNKNVSVSTIDATVVSFLPSGSVSSDNEHTILVADCLDSLGCVDGPTVTLQLSYDDRDIISSNRVLCTRSQDCYLTFNASLVEDFGGYQVKASSAPVLQVNRYTADAYSPHLLSFGLDFSNKSIYLHFSEAVDPNTFRLGPNELTLKNPRAFNFSHDVYRSGENAVMGAYNYSTVIVISAASILNLFITEVYREDIYSSSLELNAGIIADYAGNRVQNAHSTPVYMDTGSEALTVTVDYNFVYDVGSESLRISFPCSAPEDYPGNNFTVFNDKPTVANQTYTMVTEYCGGYSNDIVCYLTDDQVRTFVNEGNIADTKDDLWAVVQSFCSEQGSLSVPADEVKEDTTPVKLVAFTMDMNVGKIQLTFDSVLSSTVDVTQVKLQREESDDTLSVTLSADSRYDVAGWQLNIYFTTADRALLMQRQVAQTIASSYLSIGTAVVGDFYGNQAEEVSTFGALQAERYIGAVAPVPTTLDAFSFDCVAGQLDLTFSQLVYTKTLDLTRAALVNERGERYLLYRGDFTIGYFSTVHVNLSDADMTTIRGMNGFLVNSNHIYLSFTQALVYDVNDLLLNVTVDQLLASSAVTCSCHTGYRLTDDQTDCEDIDECSEASTDPNIESCGHTCTNTNGSYYCSCDDGYRLQEDRHTCLDINECEEGLYNCTQLCVNEQGSYHCACNTTEYVLLSDGRSCESINHCIAVMHGCDHSCVDDFGRYRCVCREGYRLGSDEHVCDDIDECAEGTADCNQVCVNTESSYTCGCYSGYQFSADGYTCIDIDECSVNNGGCDHNCTNINGSHICSCQLGYTLQQDGLRCVADPCNMSLTDPEYGSVSCDGPPVTDTTCTFTCQSGFHVAESDMRTCLGDHTWSGEDVTCKRLRCEELKGFHDAAVKQPCDNGYESSCTIECLPAYFNPYPSMTVMECVLTSEANNTVDWTERPYCQEREPCLPTPCKHNAPCSEVESPTGLQPLCDCSGSGYIGDYCHIGVVSVPNLPILTAGVSHNITISARPDNDLRVKLITDIPTTPSTLDFSPSVTELVVTLSPSTSGLFTIDFELTGTDSFVFHHPSLKSIVVRSTSTPSNVDMVMTPSCCFDESASIHVCSSGAELTFTSTCRHQTDSWPVDGRILQGVSFVRTSDLDLPLSIRSVNMEASGDLGLSYAFTPYTGDGECVSCEVNSSSTCPDHQWDCSCFSPSADITAAYLVEESLAKTFLTNLEDLLPSWIQLEALGSGRIYHNDNSYTTRLLDAEELLTMDECRGFYRVKSQDLGTYAVLVYYGDVGVTVGNDTLTHRPSGSDAFCVAVNLCDGAQSPVLISLPRGFPINELPAHMYLSSANWNVEDVFGLIVNIGQEIETVSKQPDVAIYGKLSYTGSLGDSTVELSFEGLVGLESDSLVQLVSTERIAEFSGFMTGKTYLTLNSSGQLIQLQGIVATTDIKYSGSNVPSEPCSSHHSLKVTLSQWSVTDQNNIFNSLLSDGGQFSCPTEVEMKMSASGQLYDIIFTTSCRDLTLGNFVLGGMYHKLYLLHSTSEVLRCSGISLPNHDQHQLALVSRLKESGDVPFSWFLDLNGDKDQTSILTMIDPLKKSFSAGTIGNVAVLKLFGNPVPVELSISESKMEFELEMEVLDTISQVTGVATAEGPNTTPVLRIHGNLERGTVWEDMEVAASNFLDKESERAPKLLSMSQSSLESAYNLKIHLEGLKNSSLIRKLNADATFLEAKRERQTAEVNYEGHSVLVVLDGRRWQSTELVRTLNQLCSMVDNCASNLYSSIVCGKCDKMAVPFTRRWYGSSTCSRKANKAVSREEYVVKHRLTEVEGPEVGILSCDQSQANYWEDASFGCSVIYKTEGVRSIFVQSNRSEEFVDYVTESTSYACNSPLMEDAKWQMDHFCCGLETDTTIHSANCLSWNIGCRLGRELVLEALGDSTPEEATNLYSTLDDLLKERILAELRESIAIEDLRAADKTVGAASYFHLQSEDLVTWREARDEALWNRYQETDNDTEHSISIENIFFNLTLDSKPPTTIPLEVMYSVNNCSNNSLVFDFLVSSVQSSIIAGANQLAKRAVEGNCPHSFSSATDYGTYCKLFQDVASFFGILNQSVWESINHYSNASDSAEWIAGNLDDKVQLLRDWRVPTVWRNTTADGLVDLGGIQRMIEETEELQAYQDLVDNMSAAARKSIRTAKQYVFTKWLLYMEENIGVVMQGYNCSGMVECMLKLSELVEELLLLPGSDWSKNMLSDLEEATDEILSMVWDDSIRSMDTMQAKCGRMERIVGEMLERDYWCQLTPEVDVEMSRESPVVAGSGEVTLSCSSTSKFKVHYQWLKDGVALPGETSSSLLIPEVTLESEGAYSCSVQTHKGEDISSTVSLVVHQAPQLTVAAANVTVFPEEGTVFLRCNSTGSPTPGWNWYFESPLSSSPEELEGETRSELVIDPPGADREGWYYCEASNVVGVTRASPGAYLRVLESKPSVQGKMCEVHFSPNTRQKRASNDLLKDYVAISPDEEDSVLSYNLTELLIHSVFSNSSTVVVKEAQVTVEDITQNIKLTFLLVSEILQKSSGQTIEETLHQLTLSRMEWQMVVDIVSDHIDNETAYDYSSLGVDYGNITSASVQEGALFSRCPEGYELERDSKLFCVSCPPGSYQTYSVELLSSTVSLTYPSCKLCPLGHYQPNPGQSQCLPCPLGHHLSSLGGTECTPCTPGTHQPLMGQVECALCPIGHYQQNNGQPTCDPCPLGQNQSAVGQLSCHVCPDSHYQDEDGQSTCKSCPRGYIYNSTVLGGAIDVKNCSCVENCAVDVDLYWVIWMPILVAVFAGLCLLIVIACILRCVRSKTVKKARVRDIWKYESQLEMSFSSAFMRRNEGHIDFEDGSRTDWENVLADSKYMYNNPLFANEDLGNGNPVFEFQQGKGGDWAFRNANFEETDFGFNPKPMSKDQDSSDSDDEKQDLLPKEENDENAAKDHWNRVAVLIDEWEKTAKEAGPSLYKNQPRKPPPVYQDASDQEDFSTDSDEDTDEESGSEDSDATSTEESEEGSLVDGKEEVSENSDDDKGGSETESERSEESEEDSETCDGSVQLLRVEPAEKGQPLSETGDIEDDTAVPVEWSVNPMIEAEVITNPNLSAIDDVVGEMMKSLGQLEDIAGTTQSPPSPKETPSPAVKQASSYIKPPSTANPVLPKLSAPGKRRAKGGLSSLIGKWEQVSSTTDRKDKDKDKDEENLL
jgi:hypothetical protein